MLNPFLYCPSHRLNFLPQRRSHKIKSANTASLTWLQRPNVDSFLRLVAVYVDTRLCLSRCRRFDMKCCKTISCKHGWWVIVGDSSCRALTSEATSARWVWETLLKKKTIIKQLCCCFLRKLSNSISEMSADQTRRDFGFCMRRPEDLNKLRPGETVKSHSQLCMHMAFELILNWKFKCTATALLLLANEMVKLRSKKEREDKGSRSTRGRTFLCYTGTYCTIEVS